MNQKMKKEVLRFIKNTNESDKGIGYNLIINDLYNYLYNLDITKKIKFDSNHARIILLQLRDEGKIESKFLTGATEEREPIRLTPLGYCEFDSLLIKLWRFFTNDLAKILSVVATILSIIALFISIFC